MGAPTGVRPLTHGPRPPEEYKQKGGKRKGREKERKEGEMKERQKRGGGRGGAEGMSAGTHMPRTSLTRHKRH